MGIIVLRDINMILDDEQNDKTLIKILCETANEWIKGRNYDSLPTPPIPFHIVFADSQSKGIIIKQLIKDEGFLNVELLKL